MNNGYVTVTVQPSLFEPVTYIVATDTTGERILNAEVRYPTPEKLQATAARMNRWLQHMGYIWR